MRAGGTDFRAGRSDYRAFSATEKGISVRGGGFCRGIGQGDLGAVCSKKCRIDAAGISAFRGRGAARCLYDFRSVQDDRCIGNAESILVISVGTENGSRKRDIFFQLCCSCSLYRGDAALGGRIFPGRSRCGGDGDFPNDNILRTMLQVRCDGLIRQDL